MKFNIAMYCMFNSFTSELKDNGVKFADDKYKRYI